MIILSYFDRQHNNIIHEYVARNDDVAILSATYYSTSKSFENDTVVFLLNAHQVLHLKHSELQGISTNSSGPMKTTFRIYPVVQQLPFYCKWVPFIAVGRVSASMTSLQLSTGTTAITIPVRQPYTESHDVVACFSPLFLNERWQLLLLTAEVYSHYGAAMHFYVRSMITDLFSIIIRYPNVRVNPWPALQLGSKRAAAQSFDPNFELEFRNQAAAMTDCLLLYKESAQFIVFPDTDDIIIPRLGRTYLDEFQRVFSMYPEAAVVAYNMSQSGITTTTAASTYSPADVLMSLRFKGETRWGKIVVKPERVDSAWIHRSYGIRDGYEQISLPIEMNSALHLRFWNFDNSTLSEKSQPPIYDPLLTTLANDPLVRSDDLEQIQKNFKNNMKNASNIYERLPAVSIYYPLIEQCYNRIFYNGEQHSKCKGPELCDLPQFPGVRCVNVKSEFETFEGYDRIFLHRLVDARFEHSGLGCTM
ncbi:unnamed protein product [Cylicocyclus nassatus]|uniref:Glycosyltransferase family 92 protein n=1 Tax=Cylicocyclus nassatus TaxID=53992 RepID=A0AA36LZD4_CYLNA|nr:unnamed protein product [Cylicocyclus nassatus]